MSRPVTTQPIRMRRHSDTHPPQGATLTLPDPVPPALIVRRFIIVAVVWACAALVAWATSLLP